MNAAGAGVSELFKILRQAEVGPQDIRKKLAEVFYDREQLMDELRLIRGNDQQADALREKARKAVDKGALDLAVASLSTSPILGQIYSWLKLLRASADRFRCC